jgi:hypothetical protein
MKVVGGAASLPGARCARTLRKPEAAGSPSDQRRSCAIFAIISGTLQTNGSCFRPTAASSNIQTPFFLEGKDHHHRIVNKLNFRMQLYDSSQAIAAVSASASRLSAAKSRTLEICSDVKPPYHSTIF